MKWNDILKVNEDLLESLESYLSNIELSVVEEFEMTNHILDNTTDPELKKYLEQIKNNFGLIMQNIDMIEKYQKELNSKNNKMQERLQ